MNSVILIGRLTKKPELEYTAGNTPVTKFTIAVDRDKKDDDTDFIRITVFGRQAENVCRFMDKGRQISVMGRIQTGSYQKDGKTVYTTDVIANRVEFLSGKTESKPEPTREPEYDPYGGYTPYDNDDIF